jgi:hypothetical protein
MNRRFRIYCKSFHSIAELNQELIGSLQPDQARARVLSIKDDVYADDRHDRETGDVKPTTVLAA